jgi:hypothetical protein
MSNLGLKPYVPLEFSIWDFVAAKRVQARAATCNRSERRSSTAARQQPDPGAEVETVLGASQPEIQEPTSN